MVHNINNNNNNNNIIIKIMMIIISTRQKLSIFFLNNNKHFITGWCFCCLLNSSFNLLSFLLLWSSVTLHANQQNIQAYFVQNKGNWVYHPSNILQCAQKYVYKQLTVCCVGFFPFCVLWYDFSNKYFSKTFNED